MWRKFPRYVALFLLPGCSLVVGFGELTGGTTPGGADASAIGPDAAQGGGAGDGSTAVTDASASMDASQDGSMARRDAGVDCPSACTCAGSDSCTFVAGNGATITCDANSECHVTCPLGPCVVDCGGNADCYVTGANVTCKEVSGNATCHKM